MSDGFRIGPFLAKSAIVWMRHIKKLPRSIYGTLQSGIYLFDVSRVVEELLFNGVHAGSTKIHVAIDLASCFVKVADNGHGISRNDLELLGERNATSKLYNFHEIDVGGEALDFRGKTISLLSDISLVEVITKSCGMPNGYRKVIKGGKCLCIEIDNHRQEVGTTVICRELFHNHPVRRKYLFLRPKKVLDLIKKCVLYVALLQSHISFEIFDLHSEKALLSTYSSSSPLSLVATYFGADVSSTLNQVDFSKGELELLGYLSVSVIGFSAKPFQFFYINTRRVSDSAIHDLINGLASDIQYHWRAKCAGRSKLKEPSLLACPPYIPNLRCPISSYRLTFEPSRTTVEFKDRDSILSFIEISIKNYWRDLLEGNIHAQEDKYTGLEKGSKIVNSLEKDQLDFVEVERKRGKMQYFRSVNSSRATNSAKCHSAHGNHQSRSQQVNDCLWGADAELFSKSYLPMYHDAAPVREDEYGDGDLLGLKWGSGSSNGGLDPTDRLRGNARNEDSDYGFLNGEILLPSRDSKKLRFMMSSNEPESYSNSKKGEEGLFDDIMTETHGFAVESESHSNYNPMAPDVARSCWNPKTHPFQDNFMDFQPSGDSIYTKKIHCLDAFSLHNLEDEMFCEPTETSSFLESICSDDKKLKATGYVEKSEPSYKSYLDKVEDQLEQVVQKYDLADSISDEYWMGCLSGTGTKFEMKGYQEKKESGKRFYTSKGYDLLEDATENYNLAKSTSNADWSLSSNGADARLETDDWLYSGLRRESFRENELVPNSPFPPKKFNVDNVKSNTEWLDCNYVDKAQSTPLYHIEVPVVSDGKSQLNNSNECGHQNNEVFHCSPVWRTRRCSSAPPCYRGKHKFSVISSNPLTDTAHGRRKSTRRMQDMMDKALPTTLKTSLPHFRKCTENKHLMNTNQMEKSHCVEGVHPSDTVEGDEPSKWRNEPKSKWVPTDKDVVIGNKDDTIVGNLDGILDISSGVLHLSGTQLIPGSIGKDYLESAKVLQQLDKKFIPITDGKVLGIVDQHAADERIRLEELRQNVLLGEGKGVSYLECGKELVLPEIGFQLLQNYANQIRHWGWICDTHAENTSSFTRSLNLLHQESVKVTLLAVPCILGVNLSEKDLLEFLDQLDDTDGSVTVPPAVVRVLNYKSCRGAIMFGDSLLPSQCSLIIDEFKRTSLCFQCAHGRPTTVPLVNLEALHELLNELNSASASDSWHGLRHHAADLRRAEARLASSSARI